MTAVTAARVHTNAQQLLTAQKGRWKNPGPENAIIIARSEPPPPSGVYGPGTTAFLMNENGDEGMEGSPSFDGGAAAGAGSAAAGRQRIRKSLREAEERASKGDV